jgi:glyoxylase-like metal-dependent hydrolase (beta-lactamase superfamily II)
VKDVVLTHLHYDHCGNLGRFPAARFHLQESVLGVYGQLGYEGPLRAKTRAPRRT